MSIFKVNAINTEMLSRDIMFRLQKRPANHLISAYNQMMKVMRDAFEQSEPNEMSLQKALEQAKHQAVHISKLTAEEAHEISEYIKRDINDAAEYMMDSSAEFYDWLMLDIEIMERKVMDLFLSVADHTRIELEQFKQSDGTLAEAALIYKSGEITGPGSLFCESCGKAKPFLSSDQISDCSQCGHDRFTRRQKENR
jgi:hypothetical protein